MYKQAVNGIDTDGKQARTDRILSRRHQPVWVDFSNLGHGMGMLQSGRRTSASQVVQENGRVFESRRNHGR